MQQQLAIRQTQRVDKSMSSATPRPSIAHATPALSSRSDDDGPGPALNKIERGSAAEMRAVDLLVSKGFTIVERNFRTKLGELDIVARDGSTLVFVEVRSRRTGTYGTALDAVGFRKQRRVSRMAMQFLQWRKPRFVSARFDVVGITAGEIVHIQDAWRMTR